MRTWWPTDRIPQATFHRRWSTLIAVLALLASLSGCRIPQFMDPAPKSLVESRQLAQRGMNAIEQNDLAAAEKLLVDAVDRCPVCPDARRAYAKTLWQQGRAGEALAEIDEALELSTDDPTLLTDAAAMRFTIGDLDRATLHVQQALDLDHHYPPAWRLRGRILQQQGRRKEALADYQRTLQYTPNDQETLILVAKLYSEQGRPHRALANLRHLQDQFDPGTEPQHLLYLLAENYSTSGRYADAATCLRQATRHAEATPEMFYRLAQLELASGNAAAAQQAAAQALVIEPQHAASREILSEAEVALHSSGQIRQR